MSFLLMSCGQNFQARKFKKMLEASTGQDYSVVKANTENGKYAVFKNKTTGELVAYNLALYKRKEMKNLDQYLAVATDGNDIVHNLKENREWIEDGYNVTYDTYDTYYYEVYDEECDCYYTETEYVWTGSYTEWVDTSYWYYFYTSPDGRFTFNNKAQASKDLESLAGLSEEIETTAMTKIVASQFKLSLSRSRDLMNLYSKINDLENVRELTLQEKNQFAQNALGVDMKTVESAIKGFKAGEKAEFNDLVKKAAKVNNTTSENMGDLIEQFVDADVLE